MPEGDTIFKAARVLHRALAGTTVTGFQSTAPALVNRALAGRVIERVEPYGKYLFVVFDKHQVLVTHMRMTGVWHVYKPNDPWRKPQAQARLVIANDKWVAVCFNAPVVRSMSEAAAEALKKSLGLDILAEHFNLAEARARLRALADWPIGEALLHQGTLAGIGNIYKSESLFVSRIHPASLVGVLSDAQLDEIITHARELMQRNLPEFVAYRVTNARAGGDTNRASSASRTNHTNLTNRTWVYRRYGQPCDLCGTRIRRFLQGGSKANRTTLPRTTYFCPSCQTATEATTRPPDQ